MCSYLNNLKRILIWINFSDQIKKIKKNRWKDNEFVLSVTGRSFCAS